jgi:hypothetical protein
MNELLLDGARGESGTPGEADDAKVRVVEIEDVGDVPVISEVLGWLWASTAATTAPAISSTVRNAPRYMDATAARSPSERGFFRL